MSRYFSDYFKILFETKLSLPEAQFENENPDDMRRSKAKWKMLKWFTAVAVS